MSDQPALLQRLEQEIKQAMREHSAELGVLRLLKAAILNESIAHRTPGQTWGDKEILTVLRRESKRRLESAKLYRQGNRPELAEQEEKEAVIINRYLPPAPSRSEVKEQAERLLKELGVSGPAARGQLTKAVLEFYNGAAEGALVSGIVAEVLSA